jgi:hypothetical protein
MRYSRREALVIFPTVATSCLDLSILPPDLVDPWTGPRFWAQRPKESGILPPTLNPFPVDDSVIAGPMCVQSDLKVNADALQASVTEIRSKSKNTWVRERKKDKRDGTATSKTKKSKVTVEPYGSRSDPYGGSDTENPPFGSTRGAESTERATHNRKSWLMWPIPCPDNV